MEIKPKKKITEILFFLFLALGAFVALMPFLYMISNSLKTYGGDGDPGQLESLLAYVLAPIASLGKLRNHHPG